MEGDISDSNRPQMYLFGCTLRADKREYKVDVDEDETEQQLSLKAACLGAEAEDKFHMVEVEALTYDGKTTKVPLVVLKPSVLPSMTLGGFEITPPVTLRLLSGSGPVHISGQHFVSVKDSDDEEEEHNTSPVKRPAGLMAGKKLPLKKLKMDDEEDDDDEDDEDDDSDESEVTPQKSAKKVSQGPTTPKKEQMKQNGPAAKAPMKTPVPGKDKPQAGPSKSPSLAEIKSKLSAAAKEGKPLPKTEQKFENFVKSSFKILEKNVVKDLWAFVRTLKMEKK
ncbi:nucleophosmin 1b isoform X1 [Entelurus aequoreus]|uniref:nucleophosmin 1b isoform X1 n=1 Tax=Entelurus aequoreus TaxID=161455 RepID=UPI002B1E3BCD|nr:nucleophosmin 1b isoform X1 [Entelurus aequoreus]XP_061895900.1 nucleophosmin 1b isoform X1 [Entelurus aequoreus]